MKISELITSRKYIYWNDSILLALNMLAGVRKHSPYRLPIVDRSLRIKGMITGRRILEVLIGRRGFSLRRREGLAELLREEVSLFCDEAQNVFHEHTPAQAVARYMAENAIGTVFIVDENGVFKGIVEESSLLRRMRGKRFNVKVEDVMRKEVLSINPEASLLKAANLMVDERVRRLPVVVEGEAVGIITVTDILHHILAEEKHVSMMLDKVEVAHILGGFVKGIMERKLAKVDPKSDIGTAAEEILNRDVSALLATKRKRLEGILSRVDLISGLAKVAGIQALLRLVD